MSAGIAVVEALKKTGANPTRAAFLSALAAVKFLIHYIAHHDFSLFAWYRIAVGILLLVMLHRGWL